MTGPEKNFGALDGLSTLYQASTPLSQLNTRIDAFVSLWRKTFTFFRFGLIYQNTVSIGMKPPVRLIRPMQSVSVSKLVLTTFPPIYKTRTGRSRPLKGQLWPRTR